jgi:hypothetical protein
MSLMPVKNLDPKKKLKPTDEVKQPSLPKKDAGQTEGNKDLQNADTASYLANTNPKSLKPGGDKSGPDPTGIQTTIDGGGLDKDGLKSNAVKPDSKDKALDESKTVSPDVKKVVNEPGIQGDKDPAKDVCVDPGKDDKTDPGKDPGADPSKDVCVDPGKDGKAEPGKDDKSEPGKDGKTDPAKDVCVDPANDPKAKGGDDGTPGSDGSTPAPAPTPDPKEGGEADPGMEAWMAAHPDMQRRDNILKLATITDGVGTRERDLRAAIPKKSGAWKALNMLVKLDGISKAWRDNQFKVTGVTDLESWIGIIKYVRPVIATVGDVADKVGLITTIASLLTIWFPPVAAPLAAVGRIANIVSLVCKAMDLVLSLVQAALCAIKIGKEKDPLKRVQLAGAMREGVQNGLMAGLDVLTSRIGASKTVKGATGGAKGTFNLMKGRANMSVGAKALAVGKGTLTGAKNGLKKEFTKGAMKESAKELGKASLQKIVPNVKEVWKQGAKDLVKNQKLAALNPGKFAKNVVIESYKKYSAIEKDTDVAKRMEKDFDATKSSKAGASVRGNLAKGPSADVSGLIDSFESSISTQLGASVPDAGVCGPQAPVKAPLPGPTEADTVSQAQDYDGITNQQQELAKVDKDVDEDIAAATERRDEMLQKVAPEAVDGGKAAVNQANAVAEQKAENEKDKTDLDTSKKEGQKVLTANKETKNKNDSLQGDTDKSTKACQDGMSAQPDESQKKKEAEKKAKEDYEKEKKDYENSSWLGKAWKSVKKFAKSVFDFFAGALEWVWKHVIKAIMDKVKAVIAKVMGYITSVIMKFMLKLFGGLSDNEAQTLAFGAEADSKKAQAGQAGQEMDKTNVVALQASSKASGVEKDAIAEANRCNENIATGKNLKTEIKGQQDALSQEAQAARAQEESFKARFGPYFAEQASKDKDAGATPNDPGKTAAPTVSGGMVANLTAAGSIVNANSGQAANGFQADADVIREERTKEQLKSLKESLEAQKKANGKDMNGGAPGAMGGMVAGGLVAGPVGAIVGGVGGGVTNPAQLDKGQYDKIYADAAARIRNEALVYSKSVVEAYRSGETERQGRVSGESAKAKGYVGQDLKAVEAALRQIGQTIKAEDGGINPDREEARQKLEEGFSKMYG